METFADLIKILLPAGLVLYAMYLTVRSFLNKEFEKRLVDIRIKNNETIMPIRLQAYERVCLLLERISPHQLVLRVNDPTYTVGEFQQMLLKAVREEFHHNISQQVYVSEQSWDLVKAAVEDIVMIINASAQQLRPDARGIELAKTIMEQLMQRNEDPVTKALKSVKSEVRMFF